MGVIRGGKAATAEYLRNLDRLIDGGQHKVYIIQEKRALRDYARDQGIELALGDKNEPEEPKEPSASTKGMGKPPASGGKGGDTQGQEEGPDGTRYPHKYLRRYKSPSGKWVYVYEQEGPKRTGFSATPEPTPASPEIGKKRERVAQAVQGRAEQKTGKDKAKAFDFASWVRSGLNVPEQTTHAMRSAVTYLGGGEKGMAELTKRHNDWMTKNPHITDPEDKAFAGEMLAREVLAAHQHGEAGKESVPSEPSRYASRPGGFTPKDVSLRQPWQLTRQEFAQGHGLHKVAEYENHLAQAAERGEYIPNHVLGQGDEKDPEFTERMHEFKQKYLKEQKPEVKMAPETKAYVEKFERLTENLPKQFDHWVKSEVRKEGDKYLIGGKASGFNIDSYDVSDSGIYSHMMTAPETIVLYHQYAEHTDHGRELLAKLHEHGIDCEYTVVKRASAVAWNNQWPDEAEMTYRETGEMDEQGKPKRIGYSSDYILAFRPKDDKQAESLAALLHEHAHAGEEKHGAQAHQAIHRSWYVPDVRSSKKIDGYGRAFLNIKTMGNQELCILTKNDFIKEGSAEAPSTPEEARHGESAEQEYDSSFHREYVFVDQALRDVIKAMRGLGKLGHGEVVIVDF